MPMMVACSIGCLLLQVVASRHIHLGTLRCRSEEASTPSAEETNHPREVIEAALAHAVTNQTEAAYARSDLFERRRRLMNEWATYLDSGRPQTLPLG